MNKPIPLEHLTFEGMKVFCQIRDDIFSTAKKSGVKALDDVLRSVFESKPWMPKRAS